MDTLAVRRVGIAALNEEQDGIDCLSILLCEGPSGEGPRLELHRALRFTEQDRRLGMDTYAIGTHTGACHYGGIRRYDWNDRGLHFRLNPQAAESLGLQEEFEIVLEVDEPALASLRAALPRVLVELEPRDSRRV